MWALPKDIIIKVLPCTILKSRMRNGTLCGLTKLAAIHKWKSKKAKMPLGTEVGERYEEINLYKSVCV